MLALLFSLAAAASDQDSFEKTYPRDNTFCMIGGKRVEIMIRGDQSHTEPKERMWGEHVFARVGTGPVYRLPVTERSGLYRLFQGNPSSCTKAIATMNDGKFMIFFQKMNSPHKHQLVIQHLDPVTLKPATTVHTPYMADMARPAKSGYVVRTHSPAREEIEMGKVVIGGKRFMYQDHEFPVWVALDKQGFTTDHQATFENFSYRSFFRTNEDFKLHAGWLEKEKSFTKTKLYVAINHESKSKCILLVGSKTNLTGEENWLCQ